VGRFLIALCFWLTLARSATLTWYGPGYYGHRTADGTVYTAEHWGIAAPGYVPLGSWVRVTVGERSVIAPVTDRLGIDDPAWWDASYAVAEALGMIDAGNVEAMIEVLVE